MTTEKQTKQLISKDNNRTSKSLMIAMKELNQGK